MPVYSLPFHFVILICKDIALKSYINHPVPDPRCISRSQRPSFLSVWCVASIKMASRVSLTAALLLNFLFFTLVSSTHSSCPPPKHPKHPPPPSAPASPSCPKDTLKLGVCADLLNDLLHLMVGNPPKTPCCSLIGGLADLEAAVCLCTAIKANVLGINLNLPISLSLLLNYCGKDVPKGFQCS